MKIHASLLAAALFLLAVYATLDFLPGRLPSYAPLLVDDRPPVVQAQAAPLDYEELLLSQERLLADNARQLLPQRPGLIDLYFLGLAGDAGEDVFMNEVLRAHRLFDAQFGTAGRSLLLVNNYRTLESLPIANGHNLDAALLAIAALLDTQEDILLLFMSSHGDENEGIALWLGAQPLANITPAALGRGLDRAGIRWRIIIVSACFSGQFISPLQDPHTLLITASRADRNSFGCGHHGDFTYFGEAFFGQALAGTRVLTDGFRQAYEAVGAREARERRTPSEPQLFVGEQIRAHLDKLYQRLAADAEK